MACGFLFFGIRVLIAAYDLENPLHFLMTFFSANFIILISAAILVGLGFQIRAGLLAVRRGRPTGSQEGPAAMRRVGVESPMLVDEGIENPADDADQKTPQQGGPEPGHREAADHPGDHQQ
jgi:hypothetical protein